MTEIIKLTELEINQTVHKAMGKCWHEWWYCFNYYHGSATWVKDREEAERLYGRRAYRRCRKCEVNGNEENPSYTSSWSDYGQAIEWLKQQEWFGDFIEWFIDRNELRLVTLGNALMVFYDVLTCVGCEGHGAWVIAEFIKEKEKP